MKLSDVPELNPSLFTWQNSARRIQAVPIVGTNSVFELVTDRSYEVVGWSRSLDARMMKNRDGQIAIMFWSKETGNVWQHHPVSEAHQHEIRFTV